MTVRERLARDAEAVFSAAVRAVQAPALLDRVDLEALVGEARRVWVVGAGKASIPLAGAVEQRLGRRAQGVVTVPAGYPSTVPSGLPRPARIRVAEGGHPVPSEAGARAAAEALALAEAAGPDDVVLALISGGGSALWALPPDGVALADVQRATRLLLASGVSIAGINAVRKHLSRISGGRLAVAAAPAPLVALVLSDVVGDGLATIASGPTVPDPTTFADALAVLDGAGLPERVPSAVRRHLEAGARGVFPDTPGPAHPAFAGTATVLLGTNDTALDAAAAEAARLGFEVCGVERGGEGEARAVGRALAAQALALPGDRPTCLLWGGETTVAVTGGGTGGRNQEAALAATLALDGAEAADPARGADAVVLFGGTDGVDGPTDAAGGWASPGTADAIRRAGLDPAARLADNDAHTALGAAGTLLRTGPTHTNVADVAVALRGLPPGESHGRGRASAC